jgi:hypothetical protein
MVYATDRQKIIIPQVFQGDHMGTPMTEYYFRAWNKIKGIKDLIDLNHKGFIKTKKTD